MIATGQIAELRRIVADVRAGGGRIGFVPTMGFLHEGHLALCDVARLHADFLVMSIFVNPLQFGAGEDLDRYPRDLDRDARLAAGRGVNLLFTPPPAEIYPHGDVATRVSGADLDTRLCGRFRPGHFQGVLTVVAKLFNLVAPDVAVFGQKDLQQVALVRRMARDLDFPIEVIAAPIVRDADGLALSSRNVYLAQQERAAALALHRSLRAAQDAFTAGETTAAGMIAAARAILEREGGVSMQYVEVVDVDTLDTPDPVRAGNAVAVAAHVGSTRLIDNHVLN